MVVEAVILGKLTALCILLWGSIPLLRTWIPIKYVAFDVAFP